MDLGRTVHFRLTCFHDEVRGSLLKVCEGGISNSNYGEAEKDIMHVKLKPRQGPR
jgi:hypothetical protein